MCHRDVIKRYNARKLLLRHILLKGMSNSIDDASISVFKDTIASHKMAKESVLPKAGNAVEKIQQRAAFFTKMSQR